MIVDIWLCLSSRRGASSSLDKNVENSRHGAAAGYSDGIMGSHLSSPSINSGSTLRYTQPPGARTYNILTFRK